MYRDKELRKASGNLSVIEMCLILSMVIVMLMYQIVDVKLISLYQFIPQSCEKQTG